MDNFLKGFVHEFCPKIKTFFYQRFTQDLYQKNIVLRYFREKTVIFRLEKFKF